MLLWWIGNVIGLVVVIPLVAVLAQRVVRTLSEILRYGKDIAEHGELLAGNLDPVTALAETRDRAAEVKRNATNYVHALDRLV